MNPKDDLMTYAETAQFLNFKLGTLYWYVAEGRIPYMRLGKRLVRFSRSTLADWMKSNAFFPTSGAAGPERRT